MYIIFMYIVIILFTRVAYYTPEKTTRRLGDRKKNSHGYCGMFTFSVFFFFIQVGHCKHMMRTISYSLGSEFIAHIIIKHFQISYLKSL